MIKYLVLFVSVLFSTIPLFAVDSSKIITGLFCPAEYTGVAMDAHLSSNYVDFCGLTETSPHCVGYTIDVRVVGDFVDGVSISPVSESVTLLDTVINVEEDIEDYMCIYEDTKLVFEEVELEKGSKSIFYWKNSNMGFQELAATDQDTEFGSSVTDGATIDRTYTADTILLAYPSSGTYSHNIELTNLVMTSTEQISCSDETCNDWDTDTVARDMSATSMTIIATSDAEEVSFESRFTDITCDSAESCEITCFNDLPLYSGTSRIGKMNLCIDGIEIYTLSIDDDGNETYVRLGSD